jgi:ABC-type nitrate/sulfonate/bicarbonate transport system substrate-binding protein
VVYDRLEQLVEDRFASVAMKKFDNSHFDSLPWADEGTRFRHPRRSGKGRGEGIKRLVWLFSVAVIIFCPCALPAAGNLPIRITQSTVGPDALPYWIAQDKGFFKKYGIDSEIIYVRSGSNQVAALVTGNAQFANLGGAPVIAAASRAAGLKFIAMTRQDLERHVVVRPEIKDAQGLRGKNVGVTNLGGTSWLVAMMGLEYLKLNPVRDQIGFRALGNYPVLVQAIETGNIDALVVDRIFSRQLKQKGFRVLAEFHPANAAGVVVTSKYLDENMAAAENVLKGIIDGQAFLVNPTNKPAVLKMLRDRLKISDPLLVESGYEDLTKEYKREPYPTVEGLRVFQRLMKQQSPEVAQVKVEELVDERVVRRLDSSGFIAQAYDYTTKR